MAAAVRSLGAYLRSVAEEIKALHTEISTMTPEQREQVRATTLATLTQHRQSVTSYRDQLWQNIAT